MTDKKAMVFVYSMNFFYIKELLVFSHLHVIVLKLRLILEVYGDINIAVNSCYTIMVHILAFLAISLLLGFYNEYSMNCFAGYSIEPS